MCQVWNKENLVKYLTKGTKVAVSGELDIRKHEGKYYTSLNVWELEFMGINRDSNNINSTTTNDTSST